MLRKAIPVLCLAVGVWLMWTTPAEAGPAVDAAAKGENCAVAAVPSKFWNPDGGPAVSGLVACHRDFNNVGVANIVTPATTIWICWHDSGVDGKTATIGWGTSRAAGINHFKKVCRPLGSTSPYGISYSNNVQTGNAPGTGTPMYAMFESLDDAGMTETMGHDGGRWLTVEDAK